MKKPWVWITRSTTRNKGYNHTSFNLHIGGGINHRLTLELSLHVKYRWHRGGFWFGLRPEFDIHRREDKLEELFQKMAQARMWYNCEKCGRGEWGRVGGGHPEGWDYIHRMDFCQACAVRYPLAELHKPPFGEVQRPPEKASV